MIKECFQKYISNLLRMFDVQNLEGFAAGVGQALQNLDCTIVLIEKNEKKRMENKNENKKQF